MPSLIDQVAKAITRFAAYPSDAGWYIYDMHAWMEMCKLPDPQEPPIFEMVGSAADAEIRRDRLNALEATATLKENEPSNSMIEAGEGAILEEVGGCEDLGGYFSARDLAVKVYEAMNKEKLK